MSDRRRGRAADADASERLGAWLPTPGTVVTVAAGDTDRTWTTRVEHRQGSTLIVVAPTFARGVPVDAVPGTPIVLGWTAEDGYLEADAVLTDHAIDVVLTWEVDASRVRRQQRRAAFRLPVALPIAVLPEPVAQRPVAAEEGQAAGRTRDLSEVGIRCVLPADDAPGAGDRVQVSVGLPGEDEPVLARAEVVWVREPLGREVEVGLAFVDADEERADRLRRFVFAEQLERRAGRVGTAAPRRPAGPWRGGRARL